MTKQTTVVSFCGNMVADGRHHCLCTPRSREALTGMSLLIFENVRPTREQSHTPWLAIMVAEVLYDKTSRQRKTLRMTHILYLSRRYCCFHLKHRVPTHLHCLMSFAGYVFPNIVLRFLKMHRSQRLLQFHFPMP